jgi:prophage regulatory protein
VANANQEKLTILRCNQVKDWTGLSRSTIYLRIQEGTFPKPVNLGARAVGWPSTEVAAINTARIAGKTDEEIRVLVVKLEAARKGAK